MKDIFNNDNKFSDSRRITNFAAYSACAMILFNRIGVFSKAVQPVLIVAAKMVTTQSVAAQINAAKNSNLAEMNMHAEALYNSLKSLADEHKIAYDVVEDFEKLQEPLIAAIKLQLTSVKFDANLITESKVRERIQELAEEKGGKGEGWEAGDDIPTDEMEGEETSEIDRLISKQSKGQPTEKKVSLADDIDENTLRKKSIHELKELEKKYASAEKFEIAGRIVKIIGEKQNS